MWPLFLQSLWIGLSIAARAWPPGLGAAVAQAWPVLLWMAW